MDVYFPRTAVKDEPQSKILLKEAYLGNPDPEGFGAFLRVAWHLIQQLGQLPPKKHIQSTSDALSSL